jgi:hypothetical protein
MRKKATTKKPAKKPITKKKNIEKTKPKIKKKKPTKKPAKKAIKKIKVEEKPKKAIKKVIAKIEKKPKKAVKKVVAKIKKKPVKAVKKVVAKIEGKPFKAIKKVVAKIGKKISPEKIEKIEVKKKEVYPETEYAPMAWEKLPSEYGENGITLMTVDPNKLFTFWEVREDTLEIYAGNLTVRLYDVTGVDFDGMNANSFYDIPVMERIGSCYIDVSPEKEFIADIGIINFLGTFFTVIRSNRVSTPRAKIAEEEVLPQKFYETGVRVGY